MARSGFLNVVMLASTLLAGFSLTACSNDTPRANTHFAPLHYNALSQLHFNVAERVFHDETLANPVDDDLAARAPIPPAQAIHQMFKERIFASGRTGQVVLTVDRASITPAGSVGLKGQIDVHVDLYTENNQHAGYTEVHVKHLFRPSVNQEQDLDSPTYLYTVTKEMMQNLNTELEYQIRKNMKDWLVDAGGTALDSSIQSQSLSAPSSARTPTSMHHTSSSQTLRHVSSTARPKLVHPSLLKTPTTP